MDLKFNFKEGDSVIGIKNNCTKKGFIIELDKNHNGGQALIFTLHFTMYAMKNPSNLVIIRYRAYAKLSFTIN